MRPPPFSLRACFRTRVWKKSRLLKNTLYRSVQQRNIINTILCNQTRIIGHRVRACSIASVKFFPNRLGIQSVVSFDRRQSCGGRSDNSRGAFGLFFFTISLRPIFPLSLVIRHFSKRPFAVGIRVFLGFCASRYVKITSLERDVFSIFNIFFDFTRHTCRSITILVPPHNTRLKP